MEKASVGKGEIDNSHNGARGMRSWGMRQTIIQPRLLNSLIFKCLPYTTKQIKTLPNLA